MVNAYPNSKQLLERTKNTTKHTNLRFLIIFSSKIKKHFSQELVPSLTEGGGVTDGYICDPFSRVWDSELTIVLPYL